MSNKAKQLYDVLKKMSTSGTEVIPGTVVAVNGDTIDVEVDGIIYYDVQLRSVTESEGGVLVSPKMNSTVLIQQIGNAASNSFAVCMYSEIASYQISTGNVLYKVDKEGFVLKKGSDSIMNILSDLIDEIRMIYAPMNHGSLIEIQNSIKRLLK
jgi:hypothetical protein